MIYLPNLNDTKGSLQALLTAMNRLTGQVQGLTGPRGTPAAGAEVATQILLEDSDDSFLGTIVGGSVAMFYKGYAPIDGSGGFASYSEEFNCIVTDPGQFKADNTLSQVQLSGGDAKRGIPMDGAVVAGLRTSSYLAVGEKTYPLFVIESPQIKGERLNEDDGWLEVSYVQSDPDEGDDAVWVRKIETALITCAS